MVNKDMKLQALKGFLQDSAFAHIDGHSMHDGYGCKGHDEAFTAKAEELLALIEDENYGYEPKVIETRSIRGDGNYDSRDLKSFLKALTTDQFRAYKTLTTGEVLTLLRYDDGSTSIEKNSAEDFEIRQIELSREVQKNRTAENSFEVQDKDLLDPFPWRKKFDENERREKLDRVDSDWIFWPRGGYTKNIAAYASRGGIDPEPYLDLPPHPDLIIKGRTRFSTMTESKARNAERVFRPREGFEQDEANYS